MTKLPPKAAEAEAATTMATLAVRAYGRVEGAPPRKWSHHAARGPSGWVLVLGVDTSNDECQRLRFGSYQLRANLHPKAQGLFFDPDALTAPEHETLKRYAESRDMRLQTLPEFIERVFLPFIHHWQGTIVGFNLPFVISRLACAHGLGRRDMREGFSFEFAAPGRMAPRVRIKHINSRIALFGVSVGGDDRPRGMQKRKLKVPQRQTAFVDVRTLAAALLAKNYTLGDLACYLGTEHQRGPTEPEGDTVTADDFDRTINYASMTWECFVALRARYEAHGLTKTPVHLIFSEASVAKAYFVEMGIRGWPAMQPNFPPGLIGTIMETFYGGRADVHLKRVMVQVLYCDITAAYPTTCVLMGLWEFVRSRGMKWRDATTETRNLLQRLTLQDLLRPATWRRLCVLVKVNPAGDMFPVRADYGSKGQFSIGLNPITSPEPVWYTLADCIVSLLLTGKPPEVLEAISFAPLAMQRDLRPVPIAGNPAFLIDPSKEDFVRRLVELRVETIGQENAAIKTIANSIFGIFAQLNVVEQPEPVAVRVYGGSGRQFVTDMARVEEPGEFFHPALATWITAGARLMLGMVQRRILDTGLDWAFCDTDSMAIARPGGMPEQLFLEKALAIPEWFQALSPYAVRVPLFKIEKVNRARARDAS